MNEKITENLFNEIVEREVENELLWITVSKYALFMSYGKAGIDAMALYIHYQYSAVMQKTNSVWANDKYCRQGLDWGRDRFERAKNLLIDLDLINITKTRKEDGTFGTTYIKVRTKKVDLEPNDIHRLPENPQVDLPASGKTAPNALTKKVNALTKKRNARQTIPPPINELKQYISDNNYKVNPGAFIDWYSANGWMVGKNKMKDWQATVRYWHRKEKEKEKEKKNTSAPEREYGQAGY